MVLPDKGKISSKALVMNARSIHPSLKKLLLRTTHNSFRGHYYSLDYIGIFHGLYRPVLTHLGLSPSH